jgi:enoyl-CoA hydratase
MTKEFATIKYALPEPGIARITLARPEKRNAQTMELLAELNEAFDLAAHDNSVKVIVLAAEGPDFSSGHAGVGNLDMATYKPSGSWSDFKAPGQEGHWGVEQEFFLGFCWRWRNIPKPTIAEVQGWVIAGGLMLAWPCDIIIASEDAKFTDPVVAFGVNAVEYFAHPWEVGVRKAKEMLFTGEVITAQEAKSLGMVNHVVSLDNLTDFTMDMAKTIAKRPMMGLKLAKQSVNQTQDAQGFWTSIQAAMSLQQLGHAHARAVHDGIPVNPEGPALIQEVLKKWKKAKPE